MLLDVLNFFKKYFTCGKCIAFHVWYWNDLFIFCWNSVWRREYTRFVRNSFIIETLEIFFLSENQTIFELNEIWEAENRKIWEDLILEWTLASSKRSEGVGKEKSLKILRQGQKASYSVNEPIADERATQTTSTFFPIKKVPPNQPTKRNFRFR